MNESKPKLTAGAKLKLFALVPILILRAIKYTLATLLSRRPSRLLARTLTVAFTRASTTTILPTTSQYASPTPSTGAAIRQYCATKKISHHSTPIPLPDPTIPAATLHVLTPATVTQQPSRTNPPVLLYLPGGGYTAPLFASAHLPFALRLAAACRTATLAVLECGLAPALRYPGQLVQAVEALRFLLSPSPGGGCAPGDVVLVGDSAGGNLVAGVLAHLRWGCGYVEAVETGGRRVRGAVLGSPWVGMGFEGGSCAVNGGCDGITVEAMVRAREAWGPRGEVWADLIGGEAPGGGEVEGFWRGVFGGEGRVVERAVVAVGEEEIMLDDVVAWAGMIGAEEKGREDELGDESGQNSGMLLVRSPGEAHTGAVVDSIAGVNVKGSMLSTIVEWLEGL